MYEEMKKAKLQTIGYEPMIALWQIPLNNAGLPMRPIEVKLWLEIWHGTLDGRQLSILTLKNNMYENDNRPPSFPEHPIVHWDMNKTATIDTARLYFYDLIERTVQDPHWYDEKQCAEDAADHAIVCTQRDILRRLNDGELTAETPYLDTLRTYINGFYTFIYLHGRLVGLRMNTDGLQRLEELEGVTIEQLKKFAPAVEPGDGDELPFWFGNGGA